MSDKPLYQSHEADKWFDRYIQAVLQRDEARAEIERLRAELKRAEDKLCAKYPSGHAEQWAAERAHLMAVARVAKAQDDQQLKDAQYNILMAQQVHAALAALPEALRKEVAGD